jgi:hypothetical protein
MFSAEFTEVPLALLTVISETSLTTYWFLTVYRIVEVKWFCFIDIYVNVSLAVILHL